MYHHPSDLHHADTGVRDAVRFTVGTAAVGAVCLMTALVWVSTCQGATADTAACGPSQRLLLALAAPAILLASGLRAFFRTFQWWRRGETSWAWQGAGWFLLTLMLVVLTSSMPVLTGSTMFG